MTTTKPETEIIQAINARVAELRQITTNERLYLLSELLIGSGFRGAFDEEGGICLKFPRGLNFTITCTLTKRSPSSVQVSYNVPGWSAPLDRFYDIQCPSAVQSIVSFILDCIAESDFQTF